MTIVRKSSINQSLLFLGAIIVIVIFVLGLTTLTNKLRIRFGRVPQPELIIEPIPGSKLEVEAKVIETVCLSAATIEYSLVDMYIQGGVAPYKLTVINSESHSSGPYTIDNNLPARIKVYGGDYFTAQVVSDDGRDWTGKIELPAEDKFCQAAPTSLFTDTPFPTNTEIVVVFATDTPRETSPQATNTHRPSRATPTVEVIHPATNTNTVPPPQKTDTPEPPSQKTNTPEPPPPPTPTPIIPNPRACEDGVDNDEDKLIDFPADPDCKKASDPHEDK
jgi:hypothetical protein